MLWQVQGKYGEKAEEQNYRLGAIALVGDLNNDGIRDVYCQEANSMRSALLFSGRDGRILGWYPTDRHSLYAQPVRCQDYNGDGVADLVFPDRKERPPGVEVLSGKDLSPLLRRDDIWPEATGMFSGWVLPEFHDVNGDGVADCLLRRPLSKDSREPRYLFEMAVLSGKDFSMLRRFQTEWPRDHARTSYAKSADLNGDGVGDFVMASAAGAGQDSQTSLLRAVSGADGALIWQVSGDQLPGGRRQFAVDAKTRGKTELSRDVLFGSPVVVAPDLNGDRVGEIVTAGQGAVEGKSRQCASSSRGGTDSSWRRSSGQRTRSPYAPRNADGRARIDRPRPLPGSSRGGQRCGRNRRSRRGDLRSSAIESEVSAAHTPTKLCRCPARPGALPGQPSK